jgi:hypothetical protein
VSSVRIFSMADLLFLSAVYKNTQQSNIRLAQMLHDPMLALG